MNKDINSIKEAELKMPLNIYLSDTISFLNAAPNMMQAETDALFLDWTEVFFRRDRRALYLYLCAHADELTESRKKIAENLLQREISKEHAVKTEE